MFLSEASLDNARRKGVLNPDTVLMVAGEDLLWHGFSNCGAQPASGSRNPPTWVTRMLFAKTLLLS